MLPCILKNFLRSLITFKILKYCKFLEIFQKLNNLLEFLQKFLKTLLRIKECLEKSLQNFWNVLKKCVLSKPLQILEKLLFSRKLLFFFWNLLKSTFCYTFFKIFSRLPIFLNYWSTSKASKYLPKELLYCLKFV